MKEAKQQSDECAYRRHVDNSPRGNLYVYVCMYDSSPRGNIKDGASHEDGVRREK